MTFQILVYINSFVFKRMRFPTYRINHTDCLEFSASTQHRLESQSYIVMHHPLLPVASMAERSKALHSSCNHLLMAWVRIPLEA
jgi:hypothetical protein